MRYCTGAPRGARTQLITTGYERSITRCSSDTSAAGNGSAKVTPYPTATPLSRQDSGSIDATLRRRRILFAGFVARLAEEHLPRRVTFGQTVVEKGYSFGQEMDWMGRLEKDLREFDIKSEGWRETS